MATFCSILSLFSVTAEFELQAGAKAGLYLFYNEDAYTGTQDVAPHFWLRIQNVQNMATIQKSLDGEHWTEVASPVDVSAYHHNHHGGFLALRPALMLTEGVTVKAFGYRAI